MRCHPRASGMSVSRNDGFRAPPLAAAAPPVAAEPLEPEPAAPAAVSDSDVRAAHCNTRASENELQSRMARGTGKCESS